jgi:hypothetical protein
MATMQRFTRTTTLWALTVVVALGLLIAAFIPGVRLPVIVAQVGFALLHGAQRYGWRAVGVFVAAGLVISNLLENLDRQPALDLGERRRLLRRTSDQLPGLDLHRLRLPSGLRPVPAQPRSAVPG